MNKICSASSYHEVLLLKRSNTKKMKQWQYKCSHFAEIRPSQNQVHDHYVVKMVSLQSLCDLTEAAALVPYLPLIEAVKLSLVPGWWKGGVDSCGSVPWRAFRALGYHLCHCFILSTINGSLDKVECQGWSREMTACHMASQICSLCLVARIQRFRIWNSGCCSTHNVVSHWYWFEPCPLRSWI